MILLILPPHKQDVYYILSFRGQFSRGLPLTSSWWLERSAAETCVGSLEFSTCRVVGFFKCCSRGTRDETVMCLLHVCRGLLYVAVEFTSIDTNLAAELAAIYGRPAELDPVNGAKYKCAAAEWVRHVETSEFFSPSSTPNRTLAQPLPFLTVVRRRFSIHPFIVIVVATTYGKPPWPGRSL